jgi:hypothetical protein
MVIMEKPMGPQRQQLWSSYSVEETLGVQPECTAFVHLHGVPTLFSEIGLLEYFFGVTCLANE